MKHTEGPWQVAYDPGKYIVVGCKESGICIIPNDGGKDEQIRKGNACLIAAAPEMLKLLSEAVVSVKMGLDLTCTGWHDRAAAVVEKIAQESEG